jgi:hypothetical protein
MTLRQFVERGMVGTRAQREMAHGSDLITDKELDILLSQLIEQRSPERPSDEEAAAVVEWATSARMRSQLLDMVLIGDAQVCIGGDGQPSFRLTPKGMTSAEQLIATNKSAADLQARLIAGSRGQTAVPEPKDKQ